MRIIIKIVLTFVAIVIAIPIFAAIKEVPMLKLVFIFGFIACIVAIWKYNSQKSTDVTRSNHDLDKS